MLVLLRFCIRLPLFACAGQADFAIAPEAYTDKRFDNSYLHRIGVRLADADWTGLLTDSIRKMKCAAVILNKERSA